MTSRQIVMLCLCTITMGISTAIAEMHAFTLEDGRALEAEIIDYNAKLGKVTLKRMDGKRIPVPSNIFIEADQEYIHEWDAAKAFSSDRFLKIFCDDEKIKERKEEKYKDISDTEGNVEKTLMKITAFEHIGYEITLQNMNQTAINGVRMEYNIYYEQSKESYEKPVADQKTFTDKITLPSLMGKKKTLVMTKGVEIHNDNINSINWVSGRARVGGKGEVHGMRARIYMKTSSGREIMREFCHPVSLSLGKFPWKD